MSTTSSDSDDGDAAAALAPVIVPLRSPVIATPSERDHAFARQSLASTEADQLRWSAGRGTMLSYKTSSGGRRRRGAAASAIKSPPSLFRGGGDGGGASSGDDDRLGVSGALLSKSVVAELVGEGVGAAVSDDDGSGGDDAADDDGGNDDDDDDDTHHPHSDSESEAAGGRASAADGTATTGPVSPHHTQREAARLREWEGRLSHRARLLEAREDALTLKEAERRMTLILRDQVGERERAMDLREAALAARTLALDEEVRASSEAERLRVDALMGQAAELARRLAEEVASREAALRRRTDDLEERGEQVEEQLAGLRTEFARLTAELARREEEMLAGHAARSAAAEAHEAAIVEEADRRATALAAREAGIALAAQRHVDACRERELRLGEEVQRAHADVVARGATDAAALDSRARQSRADHENALRLLQARELEVAMKLAELMDREADVRVNGGGGGGSHSARKQQQQQAHSSLGGPGNGSPPAPSPPLYGMLSPRAPHSPSTMTASSVATTYGVAGGGGSPLRGVEYSSANYSCRSSSSMLSAAGGGTGGGRSRFDVIGEDFASANATGAAYYGSGSGAAGGSAVANLAAATGRGGSSDEYSPATTTTTTTTIGGGGYSYRGGGASTDRSPQLELSVRSAPPPPFPPAGFDRGGIAADGAMGGGGGGTNGVVRDSTASVGDWRSYYETQFGLGKQAVGGGGSTSPSRYGVAAGPPLSRSSSGRDWPAALSTQPQLPAGPSYSSSSSSNYQTGGQGGGGPPHWSSPTSHNPLHTSPFLMRAQAELAAATAAVTSHSSLSPQRPAFYSAYGVPIFGPGQG